MTLTENPPSPQDRTWRRALTVVGVLTILRLVALFVTPFELYPDEAQYWLWSRSLDSAIFQSHP